MPSANVAPLISPGFLFIRSVASPLPGHQLISSLGAVMQDLLVASSRTLSSRRSTATVVEDVSVKVNDDEDVVAMNVTVSAAQWPDVSGAATLEKPSVCPVVDVTAARILIMPAPDPLRPTLKWTEYVWPITVPKVWEMVVPGAVFPPLNAMCCDPLTGPTPSTTPFCRPTAPPAPPTVQPVMAIEPGGRIMFPSAAKAGDSKLPFWNSEDCEFKKRAGAQRAKRNKKPRKRRDAFIRVFSLSPTPHCLLLDIRVQRAPPIRNNNNQRLHHLVSRPTPKSRGILLVLPFHSDNARYNA